MTAEGASHTANITFGILAFNEETNIAGAVEEALDVGWNAGEPFEVLVIDDGSTDGTAAILAELAALHSELRVVRNKQNSGVGGAITLLCAHARGEVLFVNSADGQWRMTAVFPMRDAMRLGGLDLVVGARISKQYTPYRKAISLLFRVVSEGLFGFELWDPGSIVLMRSTARRLPVQSRGVFGHAERIILARALGLQVGKVDVEHLPRRSGRAGGASITNIVFAVRECAAFYLKFRRTAYPGVALQAVSSSTSAHADVRQGER